MVVGAGGAVAGDAVA